MIVYEFPDRWGREQFHRRDENVGGMIARQVDAGGRCFYCGGILSLPVIWWLGETEVLFHPSCVIEFSLRLMRDVHEYECRVGQLTVRPS